MGEIKKHTQKINYAFQRVIQENIKFLLLTIM